MIKDQLWLLTNHCSMSRQRGSDKKVDRLSVDKVYSAVRSYNSAMTMHEYFAEHADDDAIDEREFDETRSADDDVGIHLENYRSIQGTDDFRGTVKRFRNPNANCSLMWFVGVIVKDWYGLKGNVTERVTNIRGRKTHHNFTGELEHWNKLTFDFLGKTRLVVKDEHNALPSPAVIITRSDDSSKWEGHRYSVSLVYQHICAEMPDFSRVDPSSTSREFCRRKRLFPAASSVRDDINVKAITNNPRLSQVQKEKGIASLRSKPPIDSEEELAIFFSIGGKKKILDKRRPVKNDFTKATYTSTKVKTSNIPNPKI